MFVEAEAQQAPATSDITERDSQDSTERPQILNYVRSGRKTSTVVDSVSPGRRNKTVIRDKLHDGQAERGGYVAGPFATGSSSSAAAIRDSV